MDVNDPGFKKHEEERTVFCCVTLNVNIPFFMFTRKLHGAPVSGNFSHFGLAFQDELRPPESFVPGITAQCRFQSGAPGSRGQSALLCSASLCIRDSAPSGRRGGRLSLDGRVPTDDPLRWGLVPAVGLLGPGEGQPSEERELRGAQRRDLS